MADDFTPEELEIEGNYWKLTGKKIPGNAEPVEGKCNGHLTTKRVRAAGMTRCCGNTAGKGTTHLSYGSCSRHGGSTQSGTLAAQRERVGTEAMEVYKKVSERLGEAITIGDPVLQLDRIAAKITIWEQIATEKLDELHDLETVDSNTVIRIRALVELFERAIDRSLKTYTDIMRLGIAQKKNDLLAEQGKLLGMTVMGVIRHHELGLTDEQIDIASELLNAALLKISPTLEPRGTAYIDAEVVEEFM